MSPTHSRMSAALAGLLLLSLSPVAFGQNHASQAPGDPAPDRSAAESQDLKTRDMLLASRPLTIKIQSAEFGNGAHACDATEMLRQRCDGHDRCEIEVNKSLCPGRRLPGMIQPLKVTYICRVGEIKRQVSAEEPSRLRLLCAGNRGRRD